MFTDLSTKSSSLQDQMADLIKKFALMRGKVKEVLEILKRQDDENEDGMLTRKQLGPVNCASCDKNVFNLLGTAAEFSPAKKMPVRDSGTERIARYG